jgi:hypothetical protein
MDCRAPEPPIDVFDPQESSWEGIVVKMKLEPGGLALDLGWVCRAKEM